jgi:primase-polymerase (primpol)-like protein
MMGGDYSDLYNGSIPEALTVRNHWICWREERRNGKATKVPVDPATGGYASIRDPDTWDSFTAARDGIEDVDAEGIGYVFTKEDDFVGVDLDGCRDPETGEIAAWAQDIIDRLDSYTEVSPSGTGYHVIVQGTLPDGRRRHGDVEIYEDGRFFTMTGNHLEDSPTTVTDRSAELVKVYHEYVDDTGDGSSDSTRSRSLQYGDPGGTDDQALIEQACTAANGDKFEQLWNGDTTGYESHSEADMALCCYLAFWTGGNTSRMDDLFRQSDIMREKWDAVHYADGSTYGEKTIERAIDLTSDRYDRR